MLSDVFWYLELHQVRGSALVFPPVVPLGVLVLSEFDLVSRIYPSDTYNVTGEVLNVATEAYRIPFYH